jgi:hypothetical protein
LQFGAFREVDQQGLKIGAVFVLKQGAEFRVNQEPKIPFPIPKSKQYGRCSV